MSSRLTILPPRVRVSRLQEQAMKEARVAFMGFCPFFCHYYYEQMEEYFTMVIPTLATDGRRVFINPVYLQSLKPMERAFALAHEVNHVILKHPQRMRTYGAAGKLRTLPFYPGLFNVAMDLPINAHLIEMQVGTCNPSWLHDPKVGSGELAEDVYEKLFKQLPPPPPPPPGGTPCDNPRGGGQGGGDPTTGSGSDDDEDDDLDFDLDDDDQEGDEGDGLPRQPRYGDGKRGGRPDKVTEADGRIDGVLEPFQDPGTGKDDLPTDQEFIEAVARAAQAAKDAGKFPGSIQRMVEEICEPQVQWRDHLRMEMTGRLGQRRETWDTPNRRRICLNPVVYLPGKRGHGCEDITVVIDNSGSIDDAELKVFFSEAGAIMQDCRPKLVRVIWCDAIIHRVEEARSLDELAHIRVKGSEGGGGTSFRPPFAWLEERDIKPDTLVYLTDMYPNDGWPDEPKYPVIWCATTEVEGPFGQTVHVEVKD